jgi:hypothetical protein
MRVTTPTKARKANNAAGEAAALSLVCLIQAAFFGCCALTCAHLARCAVAILRLAATESVRFTRAVPATLPGCAECGPFRTFAHRAL